MMKLKRILILGNIQLELRLLSTDGDHIYELFIIIIGIAKYNVSLCFNFARFYAEYSIAN